MILVVTLLYYRYRQGVLIVCFTDVSMVAELKCDEFLAVKNKSKVFSRMVKDVEILVNDVCLLNDEDRSFEIPVEEILDADLKEVIVAANEPGAHSEETPTPVNYSEVKPTKKPVDSCPSSQGGLGEEGALVGTTTPSGPSSPRGSGVPVRMSVPGVVQVTSNKRLDLLELMSFKSEGFNGGTSAGGRQATCLGMTEDGIRKFVEEKVPEVSASDYNDALLVIISLRLETL